MHVLSNMVDAVRPGGVILDLQVIRPDPRAEVDGRLLCEIDGGPLFRDADAAAAAVDALVGVGRLVEGAVDEHEVRKHYASGAALLEDWETGNRQPPPEAVPRLRALARSCVVRERCRLRRLVVLECEP